MTLTLMNSRTFPLTIPNAVALRQYAALAGVSPETFLNAFLQEFLVNRFGDPQSGDAEPFLGSFAFKSRKKAEHLAAWIRGRDPALEVEVLPAKDGFRVRAAYVFDGNIMQAF